MALQPDRPPVIDAHHHLWDPQTRDYPWMHGLPALQRRYDVSDLLESAGRAGVTGTVLVQTVADERETAEFLAAAVREPLIRGVVGWVPLESEDLLHRIERLQAGAGGGRLVGVRHQVHDELDAEWLDRPAVRRGLATVAATGLRYDLLIRERELPAATRAVRALPELFFVLDHAAKPPIAAGGRQPWAAGICGLAAEDNVVVKLSGLVTEAAPDWTVHDLEPYVDHLLSQFGPERLMFGSDWPVCLLRTSYQDVLDAARVLLSELSPFERDLVFAGTATTTYGLDQIVRTGTS